jgi:hypothetical protein
MLPISAPTLQAIWRYMATREDNTPADAPLFATQGGGPLDRDQLHSYALCLDSCSRGWTCYNEISSRQR